LKAPGYVLLKLRNDGALSKFAFTFNLRRYKLDGLDFSQPYVLSKTGPAEMGELGVGIGLYFGCLMWAAKVLGAMTVMGRGLHSSTFRLNLSAFCGTRGAEGGVRR